MQSELIALYRTKGGFWATLQTQYEAYPECIRKCIISLIRLAIKGEHHPETFLTNSMEVFSVGRETLTIKDKFAGIINGYFSCAELSCDILMQIVGTAQSEYSDVVLDVYAPCLASAAAQIIESLWHGVDALVYWGFVEARAYNINANDLVAKYLQTCVHPESMLLNSILMRNELAQSAIVPALALHELAKYEKLMQLSILTNDLMMIPVSDDDSMSSTSSATSPTKRVAAH